MSAAIDHCATYEKESAMRPTVVVILTIGMVATLAPATSAGPGNGPDQSGAVTRLSGPGRAGAV